MTVFTITSSRPCRATIPARRVIHSSASSVTLHLRSLQDVGRSLPARFFRRVELFFDHISSPSQQHGQSSIRNARLTCTRPNLARASGPLNTHCPCLRRVVSPRCGVRFKRHTLSILHFCLPAEVRGSSSRLLTGNGMADRGGRGGAASALRIASKSNPGCIVLSKCGDRRFPPPGPNKRRQPGLRAGGELVPFLPQALEHILLRLAVNFFDGSRLAVARSGEHEIENAAARASPFAAHPARFSRFPASVNQEPSPKVTDTCENRIGRPTSSPDSSRTAKSPSRAPVCLRYFTRKHDVRNLSGVHELPWIARILRAVGERRTGDVITRVRVIFTLHEWIPDSSARVPSGAPGRPAFTRSSSPVS